MSTYGEVKARDQGQLVSFMLLSLHSWRKILQYPQDKRMEHHLNSKWKWTCCFIRHGWISS